LAGANQSSARSGQVSLGEAKHFPARSRSQRRYAPMVIGIIPEWLSSEQAFSFADLQAELTERLDFQCTN
jgi:hypothetical protein